MSKTKKFPLTKTEKKKYVMLAIRDYEILSKIKQLEKLKLSKEESSLVKFARTQLERDWRKPLIYTLDKILRKSRC